MPTKSVRSIVLENEWKSAVACSGELELHVEWRMTEGCDDKPLWVLT